MRVERGEVASMLQVVSIEYYEEYQPCREVNTLGSRGPMREPRRSVLGGTLQRVIQQVR